jgi:DNA polymerase-3 subunit epsilon
MREIVLDTETTGIDPADGHRIIEIGCVELFNHLPTGNVWHHYINPEREVDAGAVAIHGIKTEFLRDKPTFGEIIGSLLDFIGTARLVIHNAEFDIKFLNAEFKRFGYPPIPLSSALDTVLMARKKFPGSPANLDALCRRFNIDLSGRELHGALLDAQLLAAVYLELLGGRQHGLGLSNTPIASNIPASANNTADADLTSAHKTLRPARQFPVRDDEAEAHEAMLTSLKNPIWKRQ